MNKKIMFFGLSLLVLAGGFGGVKAAEQKQEKLSTVEKVKLITKEVAKDLYDNAGLLAIKGEIARWIIFTGWFNHPASFVGEAGKAACGVYGFLGSFSNAMYVLSAFKYCKSGVTDYGFRAALFAAFALSCKSNFYARVGGTAAAVKFCMCAGRKMRRYINSKLDAVQKQDTQELDVVIT